MSFNLKFDKTPNFSANLCETCKYSSIVKGCRYKDQIIYCNEMGKDILFPVNECSSYATKNAQSLYEMKQVAWILTTKGKGKEIGFVKRRELPEAIREELDDLRE